MQKCCSSVDKPLVERALEAMLDVVNNLNDVMHASYIVGLVELKSLGRLLKRDQLQMSKLKRNASNRSSAMSVVNRLKLNEASKSIELFLFEKAVVICKRKSDQELAVASLNSTAPAAVPTLAPGSLNQANTGSQQYLASQALAFTSAINMSSPPVNSQFNVQYFYQFREMLKTDEIGITENIKNEKKKFELWSDVSSYIFEANNEHEKQAWVAQIKQLLERQLNEIKCNFEEILFLNYKKVKTI